MSKTVRDILNLFELTVGDAPQSEREKFVHLNEGFKSVFNQVDLPELHVPNATVPTVASQDWIEFDCGAHALDFIVDQSTSRKLYPEPDGMRGRAIFYEAGTGKPPEGDPHHYCRQGNRVWLRDTPSDVRTLILGFRMQPPELTKADLDKHLVTPEHLDMAVVYASAASYLRMHPPMVAQGDGTFASDRSAWQEMQGQVIAEIQGQKSPVALENQDRRQTMTLRGYSFSVQGR